MKFRNGVIEILSDSSDESVEEVEHSNVESNANVAVAARVKVNETFHSFHARHRTIAYLNAGMDEEEAIAKAISISSGAAKRIRSSSSDDSSEDDVKLSSSQKKVKATPSEVNSTSPSKVNAQLLQEPSTKKLIRDLESSNEPICSLLMENNFGNIGHNANRDRIVRFFVVIRRIQRAMVNFLGTIETEYGKNYEFFFPQRNAFLNSAIALWKYPSVLPVTKEDLQKKVAGVGRATCDIISKILNIEKYSLHPNSAVALETFESNSRHTSTISANSGKTLHIVKSLAWDSLLVIPGWKRNAVEKKEIV